MAAIKPFLQLFDIEKDFGICKEKFLNYLRPTFSVLQLDPYDAKRNRIEFLKRRFPKHTKRLDRFLSNYYAENEDLDSLLDLIIRMDSAEVREFDRIGMTGHRKRSIARFMVTHTSDLNDPWKIRRMSAGKFVQKVGTDDARTLIRTFTEMPEFVTNYPPVYTLIRIFAEKIRILKPHARGLQINFHQMFTFADMMGSGENAPEGIHQDGADFIASAIVIERAGILGGESMVYAKDKTTELLRHTLQEGEGIFQDDRELWHYVTPIKEDPSIPPAYGHRSIIGFDIEIIG